jgi:hypothetical protein
MKTDTGNLILRWTVAMVGAYVLFPSKNHSAVFGDRVLANHGTFKAFIDKQGEGAVAASGFVSSRATRACDK